MSRSTLCDVFCLLCLTVFVDSSGYSSAEERQRLWSLRPGGETLVFFFSTSQIIFHSHFPSSLFSISQQPSFTTVEEINHIFYHRLHCHLRSTVGRFARSPGEGVKTLMRSFCQHPRCIRESLGYYVSLSLCLSVCLSVCQYCRRLSVKQPLLFSQEDMPRIRKRIYKELCDCRFDA